MSNVEVPTARSWPDYRAVWRWHFYAGVICIPFVIVLSITGTIYLFKPQFEAWVDSPYNRPYERLAVRSNPALVAQQVQAALTAFPGATFDSYELPPALGASAHVIVNQNGESIRVYVHPQTLAVLHSVPENARFMQFVKRIHGELLVGNRGSDVVELTACWTLVMIVTGLFLWWPRQAKGLGGVLYPRLSGGQRMFWRDIHGVTGIWISVLAVFLIVSGLPWANFWGSYFKRVRLYTGTAVERQDWSTGSEHSGHGGGGKKSGERKGESRKGSWRGRRNTEPMTPEQLAPIDRVVAVAVPMKLTAPVSISPPERGSSTWTVQSLTANRPQRVTLKIDGKNFEVTSREEFADRHVVDRIVGTGIAIHEGQLFGWPNQLLGVVTTSGLVLLSVSGAIMWWRRREQGLLGAPRPGIDARFSFGLVAIFVALAMFMPLFGASALAVLLAERLILRRVPFASRWLGLRTSDQSSATL